MDEVFVKALAIAPAERPRRVADFARALDAAPKNVVSVPPPPMELVESLAVTENAAVGGGAAEAPVVAAAVAPAPAPAQPHRPPRRLRLPCKRSPRRTRRLVQRADETLRRRIVVGGVLAGAVGILFLGLVASAFRHCSAEKEASATASVAASVTASVGEDCPAASAAPPGLRATAAPTAAAGGRGRRGRTCRCARPRRVGAARPLRARLQRGHGRLQGHDGLPRRHEAASGQARRGRVVSGLLRRLEARHHEARRALDGHLRAQQEAEGERPKHR